MNITNEQAEYLLGIPKKVVVNDSLLNHYSIDQMFTLKLRLELVSPVDDDYTFLWEINQSDKK